MSFYPSNCHQVSLVFPTTARSMWKMRLEMVIGMQIEILNGIKKLPFYGSIQIFNLKET